MKFVYKKVDNFDPKSKKENRFWTFLKMSIFQKWKDFSKKRAFFTPSEHNALIFIFDSEKSVTINFIYFLADKFWVFLSAFYIDKFYAKKTHQNKFAKLVTLIVATIMNYNIFVDP